MKRYLIETSVENAEGSQCWYVDASSESEALEKYREGGCDLYSSDVDVTSLGEPEISGETTLDDFGDFAEKPAQPQQEPGLLDHARCDELVERVMSKLASKHNPAMQSHDLNPNIMTHHALRRSIVQAAYMVGAMSAAHGIKDQP